MFERTPRYQWHGIIDARPQISDSAGNRFDVLTVDFRHHYCIHLDEHSERCRPFQPFQLIAYEHLGAILATQALPAFSYPRLDARHDVRLHAIDCHGQVLDVQLPQCAQGIRQI
jgi:hypothetical protein